MSTQELEKIKEKIQKLLAKADSAKEIGNAEEAAAFSGKVNELLMKYNLEKADLDFNEDDPIIAERNNGLILSKKMGRWSSRLLGTLCHYNFCKDIFTTYGKRKEMTVTIIGKKENIEVVLFLYDILKNQLETAAKVAWKAYIKDFKVKIKNNISILSFAEQKAILSKPWKYFNGISNRISFYKSFFLGAVDGINIKLQSEMVKAEETYGNKIEALVKVSGDDIKKFVEKNYSNLGKFSSRKTRVNGDAYTQGKEAGKNANMARGVATGDSIATQMLA